MLIHATTPPSPAHIPMSTSTMSLAILPSSPMTYSQSSGPSLLAPSPSPAKRPKLSLNTSAVPSSIFGKGSTSLRLDTLSATSPTSRNTFRNAYNPAQSQPSTLSRPSVPILKPLATSIPQSHEQSPPVDRDETHDSASSTSSTATASTVDFADPEFPYRVQYRSILVNSRIRPRPTQITSFPQSKPMFPSSKKVAFRAPLTEDIKTTKYTMKHSDIESSTSTISTLELSPPEKGPATDDDDHDDDDEDNEQVRSTAIVAKKEPSSPQTGDKRESSDEEDDSDTCPVTPVAGRQKRHRQWRWTLGPVETSDHNEEQQVNDTDKVDRQQTTST